MRKHGFDQAPWANPHTIPLKPPYPVFHTVYLLFHLLLTNCIFCAVSWMPGFGGPFFLSHVLLENLLKLNLSRSSNPGFAIISPFSIFPKKLQTACLQNGAPLLTGIGVACRRKEAHKHRSWSGPSSHHSKHFRWRDSRVWRVIFWSCRHPVYFIFLSSLSCSSGTDFSAAVFIYGGVKTPVAMAFVPCLWQPLQEAPAADADDVNNVENGRDSDVSAPRPWYNTEFTEKSANARLVDCRFSSPPREAALQTRRESEGTTWLSTFEGFGTPNPKDVTWNR